MINELTSDPSSPLGRASRTVNSSYGFVPYLPSEWVKYVILATDRIPTLAHLLTKGYPGRKCQVQ